MGPEPRIGRLGPALRSGRLRTALRIGRLRPALRTGRLRPALRIALATATASLLIAAASHGADPPVRVDPTVGDPDTAFHIEVDASFPIRQARDRYWFVLHGPGGRECEGTVTNRVGITPTRRARRVFVDMPGVRVVSRKEIVPGPWCTGTFRGHVEFRDWRPRTRRYVIRRIGDFSVKVAEANS